MITSGQRAPEDNPDLPDPFEVISIRSVDAPPGAVGEGWYRYEIAQGPNRMIGYRAGRIENVTQAVEFIVIGLNERRKHRRGRVHMMLAKPKKS